MDATKFLEHSISEYPGQLTVIVPVCVAPFMLIKLFNNINGATHTGPMTAADPCLFNGEGGGGSTWVCSCINSYK